MWPLLGWRTHVAKLRKAAALAGRPLWRRGLRHGVAATIEHWPLRGMAAPRTVVDVGANKGQFTLFALEAWPGCRVIAFEPLPSPARRFRKILATHPDVRLFERAVGPSTGEATIHVSARDDSSSLLPIGEQMVALFPGTGELGTRQIRVAPLDQDLRPEDIGGPALLKLDVQGFELEALKGCAGLLPSFEWAYVECSDVQLYVGQALRGDIEVFLGRHGFRPIAASNRFETPGLGLVQCDVLFARADAPVSGQR